MTTTLSQADLSQFIGTENWYRHPLSRQYTYTDGVKYVAEHGGAYWLIDAILSWQHDPSVKKHSFQHWILTTQNNTEGLTGVLQATDGNNKIIARQELEYTDFPLAKIDLYLCDNVLLLPSEY